MGHSPRTFNWSGQSHTRLLVDEYDRGAPLISPLGLQIGVTEKPWKPKPGEICTTDVQLSRRISAGSTRDARHAGSQAASAATTASVIAAAICVTGSRGATP